jgi:hypothetical protein
MPIATLPLPLVPYHDTSHVLVPVFAGVSSDNVLAAYPPVAVQHGQPIGVLPVGQIWPELKIGQEHKSKLSAYTDRTRRTINDVAMRFRARLYTIHAWPTITIARRWVSEDWVLCQDPIEDHIRLTQPVFIYVRPLLQVELQ